MIPQPTIDRILDAAQITDVVSDFISLRKRGTNYVGLCPFHADKTPSFYVSPSKGICKCFACGKGGNAVHFIMEHEHMNYGEALRYLAKKYHIEVPEREQTQEEKQARSIRESLFVTNEFARNYFQDVLCNHADGKSVGMAYFRQRGIRDDIVRKFQLGYSIPAKDAFAKEAIQKGYRKEFLLKTGLCYEKEDGNIRDRFFGRVIFPWLNVSGRVVGFGGRVLDSRTKGVHQKYVNSPDSDIYSKRKELYGICQGKGAIVKSDLVYLVEGYTDVIAMHQCGLENVVASSGTALSVEQVRLIRRFTSNVTLLYDGDEAGIKASIRGIDMLLAEGMNVKVLILPDGHDPDSFARCHTATEFRTYISTHEENFIRFKTRLLLKDAQGDPAKLAALIADMAHSIALIPDEVMRYTFLKECASLLGVNEQIVLSAMRNTTQKPGDIESPVSSPQQTKEPKGIQASPASDTDASAAPSRFPTPQDVLHRKELLIVQALVRYGERIMCCIETDSGEERPLSVAEYISLDLEQDEIFFRDPLHRTMLLSAIGRIGTEGFCARRFFLSHPDPQVSAMAADLMSDRHRLSRHNESSIIKDEERLHELVPRLLLDYKQSILQEELRQTMEELQSPEVSSSPEKTMEVMKRYQQLGSTARELARRCGDRTMI